MKLILSLAALSLFAAPAARATSERDAQLSRWTDIVWHREADDRSTDIAAAAGRAVLEDWQTSQGLPISGEFDGATEARFRQTMSSTIGEGDDPVGVLLSVASTAPEQARLSVVEILNEMRSLQARAALVEVMKDDDVPSVRLAAARSLGKWGDTESLGAIARAIDVEVDDTIRVPMKQVLDTSLPIEVAPTVSVGVALVMLPIEN